MTTRIFAALVALMAGAPQGAPPSPATFTVSYAPVTNGGAAKPESVAVVVKTGEVRAAVVWESECKLAARANAVAAAPGVDQYWSFVTTLEAGPDGRPGVRVKYRRTRIAAAGEQPPEKEQWLPLDGTTALTVTESSWRNNCRYKQFAISVTARN
jgi:hypothetical protein